MCPITDGQAVNAANSNAAWLDAQDDDTAEGVISLENTVNPNSGNFIANTQRLQNKLAEVAGLDVSGNYTAEADANALQYGNNNIISDGDSHKTAIESLDNAFHGTNGHTHTGVDGEGPQIDAADIASVPLKGYFNQGSAITGATGLSHNITSLMTLKTPSTSSTVEGVVVTAPYNKVLLRQSTGAEAHDVFVDTAGNEVYGRVTESTGTWTLTFYVDLSGTETAYSFSGSNDMLWYYQELYNPLDGAPVYSELAFIPSDNVTADILDASATDKGKVNLQNSASAVIASASTTGTQNGRVANADHTHEGVHQLYADTDPTPVKGDVTIQAGSNVTVTRSGQNIIVASTGGGGGGGGTGVEQLIQKLDIERSNNFSTELDNSLGSSGMIEPAHKQHIGYALEDIASSDTSVPLVWSPVHLDDSDVNTDSATGWSAIEDTTATPVATAGGNKIGANHLLFDKAGVSSQYALARKALPTPKAINAAYNKFYWAYIPTLTNFNGVVLRLYDTTSNYREWIATVDAAGNAFTASTYHLVYFDVSNESGTTTSGTGYTRTQMLTHEAVGLQYANNSDTATGIRIDGCVFSYGDIASLGLIAHRVSLLDQTNKENVVIDSANTRIDKFVTLAAGTTNAYTAGFGATAARFMRSTMDVGSGNHSFDPDLLGAAEDTQEVRLSRILPASKAGDLKLVVDAITAQSYTITAVNSGVSIEVSSPVDDSANLLSGTTFEFHAPYYSSGTTLYEYVLSRASTGNASYSSGTITIPMTTTTSLVVGQKCTKRSLAIAHSITTKTANESYTSVSIDESAAGIKLLSGKPWIAESNIWASWALGFETESRALMNKKGAGPNLSKQGTPNLSDNFMNGFFSASGWSASNWLQISTADSEPISGDNSDVASISVSFWFKDNTGFTGASRPMVARWTSNNGWMVYTDSGTNNIYVYNDSTANVLGPVSYSTSAWHHVAYVLEEGVESRIYLDGVLVDSAAGSAVTDPATIGLQIGGTNSGSNPATSIQNADLTIWRNYKLTQSDVTALYGGGSFVEMGSNPTVRYAKTVASVSGQRMTIEVSNDRETTGVSPSIGNIAGIII